MDVAIKAEENIVVVTKHTEETAAEHMEILSEEARSPILCGTPTEGIPVTPFNLTNVANMHMCASGVAPTTPAPFSDVVSPQHSTKPEICFRADAFLSRHGSLLVQAQA